MKPNVFLAGAPKCGTTSLASWLSEHPQCFVPPKKEPHFFGNFLNRKFSQSEYESLYLTSKPSASVRIDASTSYFTMPKAVDQIIDYCPDARFIVMLRNPVDLAYSLHAECLYLGRETESSFEKAWRLQDERSMGNKVPLSCNNPAMLLYKNQSMLGKALSYLLSLTGNERVHWVFLEDLQNDPRLAYRSLMEFLEVADDGRSHFPVKNRSKIHRYPRVNRALRAIGRIRHKLGLPGLNIRSYINRHSKIESPREPLTLNFRRELYDSFKGDIRLLEQLTGRDLSHWAP